MATLAQTLTREQSFWQRMMIGIALFVVFAFSQFALRGFVDYQNAPLRVHLHGVLMLSWLGLSVVQATLVRRENIAMHRTLGWLGVAIAAAVVVLALHIGMMAVTTGRQPPFFAPPYFLALTGIGAIAFGAMVAAAIAVRRRTDWHRRFMVASMVMILEPALGRLLPMPLMMPWGAWVSLALQLVPLAILARHDRATIGHVHRATLISIGAVCTARVLIELLGRSALFEQLALRLTAG